jgi:heterodisulfide reductase subunit A-like polyferredoxin
VKKVEGNPGNFKVTVQKAPRFIDAAKCTACGDCAEVCPVDLPNEYDQGLSQKHAIFKKYAQAIPSAFAIAKRDTAPCKATCPARVSVQGYIALIKQKKYSEALALFKDAHPFPGICGRVCHHPCEGICTRTDVDKPLAIQYLHRFLADVDLKNETPYVPEKPEPRNNNVAVIGSGPAGLSAAYFLALRGYPVTVFEKLPVVGGMMTVGIPAYRLPRDIIEAEVNTIEALGVTIKTGVTFGEDITLESLKADGFEAVFMATGLHLSRRLNVDGEDTPGVIEGVEFLRDAALEKDVTLGDRVIVIGGGNVAIDVALSAKRLGAKEVSLVCLEKREEMPAWDYEIEEALEEGVTIINSLGPKQFLKNEGRFSGAEFKQCTAVFDEKGNFNPSYDETNLTILEGDNVIVAIGQAADLSFADKDGIAVTPRGGLEADPITLETPLPGVFAGGDVFYGPKSVVEAVASGKEACESIHRFLNDLDLKSDRAKDDDSYEKPDVSGEPHIAREVMQALSLEEREGNFKEIALGYSEEETLLEVERCVKCGICSECYQCVTACKAEAVTLITHDEQSETLALTTGSIILAPGFQPFDPSTFDTYHYTDHPNVMTSMEFERILSASGPTMGHLTRVSDHAEPKKIAWIQCVGSRDINRCDHSYCSSVCCMYAIKEAVIAKEHGGSDLDCAIFYMDMRTHGKDFEIYYNNAKDKHGVRFIRSRVHTIDPMIDDDSLILKYATDTGEFIEETFDMVVLSVGMEISPQVVQLAEDLGVDVNEDNFCQTETFHPVNTSAEGVYVCGAFQGPKDIPQSVVESSAAACASGMILSESRGTEVRIKTLPDEIDVAGLEPRVGVFVCNCGINIGGVVDVPGVAEYAKTLPNVVLTDQNLFTCSQDTQEKIKEVVRENNLNRVVVAACSPTTHEALFQDSLQESGLNKYLFEMANIRNHNSWVHRDDPEAATNKAKDLIRMAVARASLLEPLNARTITVNKRALVIGGGIAGMTAALGVADQGFEVVLVEKEPQLGGLARELTDTIEGDDVQAHLSDVIALVEQHENIQVLTESLIVDFNGFKGNFTTEVMVGPSMYQREIDHGIVILATGAREYKPTEFLYGQDDRVITHLELDKRLYERGAENLERVVMVQCVGSRNEENPNCSRICCQSAVKNALQIKKLNPETDVFILYRDIRTYGIMEEYYREARRLGVLFFRFDKDHPPQVESTENGLMVRFKDHVLQREIQASADIVALSTGMRAEENDELSSILKVARNEFGYFMEAHVKLRPVDMASDAFFVCGTAHSPKLITESISQAMAAASRAVTFLAQDEIALSVVTATVDQDKCAACLVCVRSCPYDVPKINADGVSEIDEALCRGCGVCASECPAKVIQLDWYEDNQVMSKVEALLEGVL